MIGSNIVNQLMMTSSITQPAPSPQPSTNLRGEKILMYDLDISHKKIQSQPRTIFSINEQLSSKFNKHKLSIKKLFKCKELVGCFRSSKAIN